MRVGASDTLAFAESLIDDYDVVAIPGDVFSPVLAGWLRTSFAGPLAGVREGLARIATAARELT